MRPPNLTSDRPAGWAEYYMGTLGWSLTPIPRSRKGPIGKGWNLPRTADQPDGYISDPTLAASVWKSGGNLGVILGPSGLATIDVDDLDGTGIASGAAGVDLNPYLTATIQIEGRPGRAKAIYRVPAELNLATVKLSWPARSPGEKPVTVFELRTGPVQDVLPPSIHPDTRRPYRWVLPPWEVAEIPYLPKPVADFWQSWSVHLPTMVAACPWVKAAPSDVLSDVIPPQVGSAARAHKYDGDEIRREIRERFHIAGLLQQLGAKHAHGPRWNCPFHPPDDDPSFWVFITDDGTELWVDGHGDAPVGRRGASGYFVGDAIDLYQQLHNLSFPAAIDAMSLELGLDTGKSRSRTATISGAGTGGEGSGSPDAGAGDDAPKFKYTDYGNAERLISRHGEDLHYCFVTKEWYVWDGRRWATDLTGEIIRRAKEAVRSMREGAVGLPLNAAKELFAHAMKSEQEKSLKAMVALAQSEPDVPIVPLQLDADALLVNLENGTLDLRVGRHGPELRSHLRGDLITRLAPVTFDAKAECPRFLSFLDYVLGGDEELIAYVRRLAGYCLTGDTSEQALFIFYGSGRNGKSTLLNLLNGIMGDYAMQAASDLLLKRRNDTHPTGVADLRGQRLVLAIETESDGRLAEALVKQLTGGDSIRARHLYQNNVEFTPTHKIILATNHRPLIEGGDFAIWRRIHLVPFSIRVADEDLDKELPEKLKKEAAGILNWAVAGYLEWRDLGGLAPPDVVLAATADYRREMDVLGDFLESRCELGRGLEAPASGLYRAYQDWCAESRLEALSMTAFGSRLTEREIVTRKQNGRVVRVGIRLSAKLVRDEEAA